ncbi:MAG TPA: hypothetical protein VFK86_10840 [Bauldia sp.]|nr:hypothetical protein [Bauldia sp.]
MARTAWQGAPHNRHRRVGEVTRRDLKAANWPATGLQEDDMEAGQPILTAIQQEGLLSLTFGLAMLIATVVLVIALRNTLKSVARAMTGKAFGPAIQQRVLRRLGRAAVMFGFLMITATLTFVYLLDASAWLAVNDPYTSLVLRAGPVDFPRPGPGP